MKVRNKFTGEISHSKNNDPTTLGLIRTGLLEFVPGTEEQGDWIKTGNGAVVPFMDPPKPPVVGWAVGWTSPTTGNQIHVLRATCTGCQHNYVYDGAPEKAPDFVHCGRKDKPPKEFVLAYAKRWVAPPVFKWDPEHCRNTGESEWSKTRGR
jgi:hypothetical protein